MTNLSEKIAAVCEVLATAKSDALELLKDQPNIDLTRSKIDNSIRQLANSLKAQVNLPLETEKPVTFEPLTELDGMDLRPKQVKEEDILPTKDEKQLLLDRIKELEVSLPEKDNETILKSYVTAEDKTVIRGLGKKAKVHDYAKAEINGEYLDHIREGLSKKEVTKKADKKAVLAQIKAAETKEQIEDLAKGSEDEEIQNAALNRIIEIES